MTPIPPRTAIVSPIADLLKSKRFLVTLAGVVTALIVALIPGLGTLRAPIITLITVALAVLVGGYSVSDAVTAGQGAVTSDDPTQAIKDAVNEALKELLPDALEQPAIVLTDAMIDQLAAAIAAKSAPPVAPQVVVQTGDNATVVPSDANAPTTRTSGE